MEEVTLETLIEMAVRQQYWERRTYNQHRFAKTAEDYARKVIGRFAASLPADLHFDVVQDAFMKLFERGEDALNKMGGKKLFRECVVWAIRHNNASYTAPGELRRKTNADREPAVVAAEHVSVVADRAMLARSTVIDDSGTFIDFDKFESLTATAQIKQIEDSIDVGKLMSRATPLVQQALQLICVDGELIQDAAATSGISRFALKRKLDAFYAECRAA